MLRKNWKKKKNVIISKLEEELQKMNLKLSENEQALRKINKKLNVLNERETFFVESKDRIEKLEKSVENLMTRSEKKADENKCEKCEFVAKNEQGLKVHMKAKHTEHNRIKCWKCDFTCATKSELTEHNDTYYYSHRMSFYPHRKKDYLEEFEELKRDGFVLKEDIVQEVLNWADYILILP